MSTNDKDHWLVPRQVGLERGRYPVVVSMRVAVCGVPLLVPYPAAHSGWPAAVAATVARTFEPASGSVAGTICQAVPFHCSASVELTGFCKVLPTAQTSLLPSAITALRVSCAPLAVTDGLGTSVQLVPFHCSVTVWLRFCSPTAHTSLPLTTAIAVFTGWAWAGYHWHRDPGGKAAVALLMAVALAAGLRALHLGGHLADTAAMAGGIAIGVSRRGMHEVVLATALGCAIHVVGDMLTTEGCPLLWPVTMYHFRLLPRSQPRLALVRSVSRLSGGTGGFGWDRGA
jgi:hypothetical protein